MTLDHDSGEMSGEVVQGNHAGARLDDLDDEQLKALLREVSGDAESAALLEAWLERYRPDWPQWGERGEGREEPAASGPMSVEEAREILGVDSMADARQIRAAHRRLMKNVHPDQGGSTYLAAKLNEARDLLLKGV
jgi:DnaJ-domain-containing protein 1